MSQTLDSVPAIFANAFTCCYVNVSSKIQIARITNVDNWYFERVVFPGQNLVFEAPSDAMLEIHCGMMASAILSDMIPCERLRLNEEVMPFELSLNQINQPELVVESEVASESNQEIDSQSNVRELAVAAPIAS